MKTDGWIYIFTYINLPSTTNPGELRAICGGGRYDKLLETFGGEALPAVGFGFGDAVIMELLEAKNLKPALPTGGCVFGLKRRQWDENLHTEPPTRPSR